MAPIGGPVQPTENKDQKQQNAQIQFPQVAYGGQYPPYMYQQAGPYIPVSAIPAAAAAATAAVKKTPQPKEKEVEITTSEFIKKKMDKQKQIAKKKFNNAIAFLKPFSLGAGAALLGQSLYTGNQLTNQ